MILLLGRHPPQDLRHLFVALECVISIVIEDVGGPYIKSILFVGIEPLFLTLNKGV
jgi:hypothetical protein